MAETDTTATFRSRSRLTPVTTSVVDKREMTGAELLELAGIPEGNQLFREVSGTADDDPIGPDEPVELHRGEKFYAVPVDNFG